MLILAFLVIQAEHCTRPMISERPISESSLPRDNLVLRRLTTPIRRRRSARTLLWWVSNPAVLSRTMPKMLSSSEGSWVLVETI